MGKLVLLGVICSIHAAYAATHSLKYLYTGVTGDTALTEFTIVGLVDDEQFMYYDSNIKEAIPKAEWMEIAEDKNYWDTETQRLRGEQQRFRAMIVNVRKVHEQTGGLHTLQQMVGCEWDEETRATDGFSKYGYDGEDFLRFNAENKEWIASSVPQAFPFALRWNHNQAQLDYEKNYITQECIDWLKKYVSYGRSTLERRVPPEVFLFQKDSSSPVVCHATGFFSPRGINVTWQRDGEEVQEDVVLGVTLPSRDGTFQITSRLTVKPGDTHTYTCTVQHKSLEKDIIKTHSFSSDPSMGIIIGANGCVVGVLIVALAVIGVIVWKKRCTGYGKKSSTDTNSKTSHSKCPIESGCYDTSTESRYSNGSSESICSDSSKDSNDSGKPLMKKRHT